MAEKTSLTEILAYREKRVCRRNELLQKYRFSMAVLGLNIPGEYKDFPWARRCFRQEIEIFKLAVEAEGMAVSHEEAETEKAGYTAYISVDTSPQLLKALALRLEETHLLGRLFDIDVYDPNGNQLSRQGFNAAPRYIRLNTNGDTMFTVQGGNNLILQNLELEGHPNNNSGLIHAANAGTVTMGASSVIHGSIYGVMVSNAGTFNMDRNSKIINNRMKGVFVRNGGYFNMYDYSSISGTLVGYGARVSTGTMTMNDRSTITGNNGNGASIVTSSTLTMNDNAAISANLGGAWVSTSRVYMNDFAEIFRNSTECNRGGSGIFLGATSTLTMRNNARIRNNEPRATGHTGGVRLENSFLHMYNSAEIFGNSCVNTSDNTSGGGVSAVNSTINMRGSSSISGNTNWHSSSGGGGVSLRNSTLIMHDDNVRIRGNFSSNHPGGGVSLANNSILTIHRGLIYGENHTPIGDRNRTNNSNNSHAIFIAPAGGTANVAGTAVTTSRPNNIGRFGTQTLLGN